MDSFSGIDGFQKAPNRLVGVMKILVDELALKPHVGKARHPDLVRMSNLRGSLH
jgi:hypothetical protein